RGYARPRHLTRITIHGLLEKIIQFETLPHLPAQETSTELACSLQANSIYQDANHLRIIGWWLDMRGEQFQLFGLALLVENLDRLQPARLRRTVQLPEITERPLTRTAGPPYRFHQRPVGVILAVFTALMRPQKHRGQILSPAQRTLQEGRSALHRVF